MSFSTSSILRGSFTSTGAPFTLSVPGVTNFGLYNISNISANAPNAVWWANWNFGMPQGSALVGTSNGGPTDVLETFSAANGVALVDSSVQALGPAQAATAVSQAAAAVVTSAGHTFLNGDVVRLVGTTGMFQIASMDFTVGGVVAGVSYELSNMDTSGFAAPATAGSARLVPFDPIYYPRRRLVTKISQAAVARVTLAVTHGFTVGQKVRMVVPVGFGMPQMNGILASITAVGNADAAGSTNTIDLAVNSAAFAAFAFPGSFASYFGQFAQVVPVGDDTPTLAGATNNQALIGVRLGTAIVGAAGNLIQWHAERGLTV